MKRFLKLYKVVDGEKRLVDYGAGGMQAWKYYKQGYVMEWSRYHTPVYKVLKAQFDELWDLLPAEEQARLRDLTTDMEMGIEERLHLLKAETFHLHQLADTIEEDDLEELEPMEEAPVYRPKRPSLFSVIKEKVRDFMEETFIQPMFAFGHF